MQPGLLELWALADAQQKIIDGFAGIAQILLRDASRSSGSRGVSLGPAPLPGRACQTAEQGRDNRSRGRGQRRPAPAPAPGTLESASRTGQDRLTGQPSLEVIS